MTPSIKVKSLDYESGSASHSTTVRGEREQAKCRTGSPLHNVPVVSGTDTF